MSNHPYSEFVARLLESLRSHTGLSLQCQHTGGGCIAYEARLESGHWLVVTNSGLDTFERQLYVELLTGKPQGLSVGIYPRGEDWSCREPDEFIDDPTAFVGDLHRVATAALRSLAGTQ